MIERKKAKVEIGPPPRAPQSNGSAREQGRGAQRGDCCAWRWHAMEEPAVPSNTFTKDQPFVAVVESKRLLTGPKALGETYHIVLRTNGAIPPRPVGEGL